MAAMVGLVRLVEVVIPCEADSSHRPPWAYYENAFGEANAALDLTGSQLVEWSWIVAETAE